MSASILLRAAVIAISYCPPALTIVAMRGILRRGSDERFRLVPVMLAVAVLIDWASFVGLFFRGYAGGFGSHVLTTSAATWFWIGSLILTAIAITIKPPRWQLGLASILICALWLGSQFIA
jgi:hypothetical protein